MNRAMRSMRQIIQLRYDLNEIRNNLIRLEANRRRAENTNILALNNETEAR